MDFNRDIIVLYSEEDNQPIEGGLNGWVSSFYKFMDTLLSQITKGHPAIKMIGSRDFTPDCLDSSAAVIAIVSRNLAGEAPLVKYLNSFGNQAKKQDRLVLDGICRFFKVHKGPFDDDPFLPAFQEFLPYDLYMVDPMTGEAMEFRRFFGAEAERSYWMKLVDMAYDINHILNTIRKAESRKLVEVTGGQSLRDKTVYLASTGVDMVIQRDVIRRELIRHGYQVLPNHTLPKEAKLLEHRVKEDLAKCRLSIHLVGEDYGYKPKGSDLSVVDIQNRVASKHTYQMSEWNESHRDKEPFSRLIWVSPDLNNVSERQKIFIEDLKSDAAALEEAEVLQITLQELKGIIREELVTGGRFNTQREVSGYQPADENDSSPVIYLISDKEDLKHSKPLREYLTKKGYRVVSPSYDGDLIDIRYIHQENLRRCDASIIYFGEATEEWIKTKLKDLLKAPGFGRNKPLRAKAVYFDGEKQVDMGTYKKNNALILGNNGGFRPEHLSPFLERLKD
ncbi:MAG: hypothetical protein AAGA85_12110 [Bacteroidota bacterium]